MQLKSKLLPPNQSFLQYYHIYKKQLLIILNKKSPIVAAIMLLNKAIVFNKTYFYCFTKASIRTLFAEF